jgi:hypothetical protein
VKVIRDGSDGLFPLWSPVERFAMHTGTALQVVQYLSSLGKEILNAIKKPNHHFFEAIKMATPINKIASTPIVVATPSQKGFTYMIKDPFPYRIRIEHRTSRVL